MLSILSPSNTCLKFAFGGCLLVNTYLKMNYCENLIILSNIQILLRKFPLSMWQLASVGWSTITNLLQSLPLAPVLLREERSRQPDAPRHSALPPIFIQSTQRGHSWVNAFFMHVGKGAGSQAWERSPFWHYPSGLPAAKRLYPHWPASQCQGEHAILKSCTLCKRKSVRVHYLY